MEGRVQESGAEDGTDAGEGMDRRVREAAQRKALRHAATAIVAIAVVARTVITPLMPCGEGLPEPYPPRFPNPRRSGKGAFAGVDNLSTVSGCRGGERNSVSELVV